MKKEQVFSIRSEQVEDLRERLKQRHLLDSDWDLLDGLLIFLFRILRSAEEMRISLRRLQNLLFGKRTEKEKRPPQDPPAAEGRSGDEPSADAGSSLEALVTDALGEEAEGESPPPEALTEKKKVPPGHGRNPATAYVNAEVVPCPFCGLAPGDRCPACGRGRMRPLTPVVEIRLIGNPPVSAKRYEQERLRCNACGNTVTAELPAEAGSRKYTPSAQASVAVLKYSGGMAFNRLNLLEQYQGVPLPASNQWEMVEEAANALFPVYRELHRQAAGGNLLFIDDTPAQILELGKPRSDSPEDSTRKGVFTTGILARIGEHWVALYLSGPRHAGENVRELLASRPEDLPPPIQMSDALSRNLLPGQLVVLVLCLVHSRRNFFEIRDFYPEVCQQVLETIKAVYKHEASIQEQQLSHTERLAYHQEKSLPLLQQLRDWLSEQVEAREIEPNSALGKATAYFLKHWQGLTGFCRIAGAPLDNNPAERMLKLAILLRKNCYFFKTEHGAAVGGILMSLIQTARLAGANPFHFLETLLTRPPEIRQAPGLWLPWNYQAQLTG